MADIKIQMTFITLWGGAAQTDTHPAAPLHTHTHTHLKLNRAAAAAYLCWEEVGRLKIKVAAVWFLLTEMIITCEEL